MADGNARVVVGVTGATGAIYAVRLLERLRRAGCETHLVATPAGLLNVHHELGLDRKSLEALADVPTTRATSARRSRAARSRHGDGGRAVLDEVARGDRQRPLGQPADARRRRRPEGTAPPAADGAGDAAQPRPPAQHDERDRDGRRSSFRRCRRSITGRRRSTRSSTTRSSGCSRCSASRAPHPRPGPASSAAPHHAALNSQARRAANTAFGYSGRPRLPL